VYLIIGGYMTIIRTDVFQGLLMLLIVIGVYGFSPLPDLSTISGDILSPKEMNLIIGLSLIGLTAFSYADLWQRIFSARTGTVARHSLLWVVAIDMFSIFAFMVFASYLIGFLPETTPANLFSDLFARAPFPPLLIALAGIFTISAVMSTIDTQTYLFTSGIAKNLLRIDPETQREKFVRTLRWSTFLMLAVLVCLALKIEDLIMFLAQACTAFLVLTPAVIYAMLKPRLSVNADKTVVVGILIGLGVFAALSITGRLEDFRLIGVPLLITSLLTAGIYIKHAT
jgi:Na+/proline symporter